MESIVIEIYCRLAYIEKMTIYSPTKPMKKKSFDCESSFIPPVNLTKTLQLAWQEFLPSLLFKHYYSRLTYTKCHYFGNIVFHFNRKVLNYLATPRISARSAFFKVFELHEVRWSVKPLGFSNSQFFYAAIRSAFFFAAEHIFATIRFSYRKVAINFPAMYMQIQMQTDKGQLTKCILFIFLLRVAQTK